MLQKRGLLAPMVVGSDLSLFCHKWNGDNVLYFEAS